MFQLEKTCKSLFDLTIDFREELENFKFSLNKNWMKLYRNYRKKSKKLLKHIPNTK